MPISMLDFSPIVVAPYLIACVLMLRLHLRKDGSGNREQAENPFARTALILAFATLVPPIAFVALRMFHVFIPYGTFWFGGAGVIWAAYAVWLQRRDGPPVPVASKKFRPPVQKHPPVRPGDAVKRGTPGGTRP